MRIIQVTLPLLAGLGQLATAHPVAAQAPITLSRILDTTIAGPLPESFLSYSVEFAFFPDFAGTDLTPQYHGSN